MNRFDALSIFIAVCEAQGFAPAARKLGISASVATRAVAGLEEKLNVRLLQRTTRSLRLTEAGQTYLERARRIMADLDEADQTAQSHNAEPAGLLSISAPVLFGRMHVVPALRGYMEKYPKVTVDLRLSDGLVNLVEEGFDLAVRIGHLPDSQLMAVKVGQTKKVVVAAPSYLDRVGRPDHPSDLEKMDIISFSQTGSNPDWRFENGGREIRPRLSMKLNTNNADAAIAFAKAGGGATRILCYQSYEAMVTGELEQILTPYAPSDIPVQLVYPSSRMMSVKVRSFIDFVQQTSIWNFVLPTTRCL